MDPTESTDAANCSSELERSLSGVDDPDKASRNDASDSIEHSPNSSNHMLSPDIFTDSSHSQNVSRYGRTRKLKTIADFLTGSEYSVRTIMKSPKSAVKKKTPDKKKLESPENQPNSSHILCSTPQKNKVYVYKDLSQNLEKEETVNLMRNMFSPVKNSSSGPSETSPIKLEQPSSPIDKIILKKSPQGLFELSSKKIDQSQPLSDDDYEDYTLIKDEEDQIDDVNSDEQDCGWVEGDLAWARVGGHPLWPCLITRDAESKNKFAKKKSK